MSVANVVIGASPALVYFRVDRRRTQEQPVRLLQTWNRGC